MTEITAKEIILRNRAGEYLIPYTIPYTAGDGISISADSVISTTGAATWGSVTGTLSSQTDLQEALDLKADKATTLAGYGVTDAYTKTEVDDLLGDISSLTDLNDNLTYLNDNSNRLYTGRDLSTIFADEITENTNIYTWLKTRKTSGDYTGMRVGDYFKFTMSAGTVGTKSVAAQEFTARILGFNTYKGCGDSEIGNMIYFGTDEVCSTPFVWNPNNSNNGTSAQNNPWLSSAMYAYLNGVNNYSTSAYNSVAHGASASGKGFLQLLPTELQNVLVEKRMLLDTRYSASGLLNCSTNWAWGNGGKLWLPNEIEVYGCGIRSNLGLTSGFWFPEAGLSIQFPWFANNCQHRCKKDGNGNRRGWWLSSVAAYTSYYACSVDDHGSANSYSCSNTGIYVPFFFCI